MIRKKTVPTLNVRELRPRQVEAMLKVTQKSAAWTYLPGEELAEGS